MMKINLNSMTMKSFQILKKNPKKTFKKIQIYEKREKTFLIILILLKNKKNNKKSIKMLH